MMSEDPKQVILVRKDLKLGKGKMAAQVAHASVSAYLEAVEHAPKMAERWLMEGQKKVVLWVKDEHELFDLYRSVPKKIPSSVIADAGLTQLDPGTVTCAAIGPWLDKDIHRLTGHLKLA